jgi:pimeloyl-ACP methyl ester carboxylesterase
LSDALAERYHVVAPDFHGYGRSDPLPRDGRPYFEHDLAIVDALLAQFDGPAHIIGHSLGGALAVRAAITWPARVTRLALIEPVLFALIEQTDDPRRIGYLDLAHAMLVFERFGAPEQAARHFMDYWIGPGSIDTFDADRRAYVVETIGRVSDEWLGTSMYAPGALTAADISTIAAKTLIVCAKNTKPAARAVVEVLRQALPGADYVEIPGAGHMAPVTHPDRVNAKLIEFIDSPAA